MRRFGRIAVSNFLVLWVISAPCLVTYHLTIHHSTLGPVEAGLCKNGCKDSRHWNTQVKHDWCRVRAADFFQEDYISLHPYQPSQFSFDSWEDVLLAALPFLLPPSRASPVV